MLRLFSLIFLLGIMPSMSMAAFLDFNDFTVTTGPTPADSPAWAYSSRETNNYSSGTESAGSGWVTKDKTADNFYYWFYQYISTGQCGFNTDTYGYMDISASGHTGNALRSVVTGGIQYGSSSCSTVYGTQLYNKESYDISKLYSGGNRVGRSYLYYTKTDNLIGSSTTKSVFSEASGKNRWSMYIRLPDGWSNNIGLSNNNRQTFQVGMFLDPVVNTSRHQYFNFMVRGGGWAKVQIEETTNGDNGGDGTTRYIPDMYSTMWKWYTTTLPYDGNVTTPWEILYDNIEFTTDLYTPQNQQTISNIAVLYRNSDSTWEISFNDKYKVTDADSTYEVRYSSSPITNENWSSATPISVKANSDFGITSRSDGKFQKRTPGYQGVWAHFNLSGSDSVAPGQTIYFAIKDISQLDGSSTPASSLSGVTRKGGRPYDTSPEIFDYATDAESMQYIKRISYTVASGGNSTSPTTTSSKVPGRYAATQQLALTASAGTTKYCLTPGCTPTTTYSAPFKVLQNLARQTVRYQSTDGAGVETVRESVFLKQRRR